MSIEMSVQSMKAKRNRLYLSMRRMKKGTTSYQNASAELAKLEVEIFRRKHK